MLEWTNLLEVDEVADRASLAELRIHLVVGRAELVEDSVVGCKARNHT